MIRRELFSAKVMLFGEYSILLGSPALSIPFTSYHASLKMIMGDGKSDLQQEHLSNNILHALCDHYRSMPGILPELLDLDHLMEDINEGLYLDSTIPQRYGIGSSGALCAALYSRYAFDPLDPDEPVKNGDLPGLRKIFISMESYFHGKSSGFDPLVSYLQHPLKIREDGQLEIITLSPGFLDNKGGIFLLDSGQSSETAPLVRIFMNQYTLHGKLNNDGKEFCRLSGSCITGLIKNDPESFHANMKALSAFHLNGLLPMIPGHIHALWEEALKEEIVYFKLCGSGGGGFLTGFAPDYERARSYLQKNHYRIIKLNISNNSSIKTPTYHDKSMDQSFKSDSPYH